MRWVLLALALFAMAGPAQAACAEDAFEGNAYVICRFDLRADHLQLFT